MTSVPMTNQPWNHKKREEKHWNINHQQGYILKQKVSKPKWIWDSRKIGEMTSDPMTNKPWNKKEGGKHWFHWHLNHQQGAHSQTESLNTRMDLKFKKMGEMTSAPMTNQPWNKKGRKNIAILHHQQLRRTFSNNNLEEMHSKKLNIPEKWGLAICLEERLPMNAWQTQEEQTIYPQIMVKFYVAKFLEQNYSMTKPLSNKFIHGYFPNHCKLSWGQVWGKNVWSKIIQR